MTTPALWSDYFCELGEGARWVDDRLVHVDILSGRLLELPGDRAGEQRVLAELDVPLGAVAPIAGRVGSWIAAAGHGIARLENGHCEWIADFGENVNMRVNDAVCDPSGRFWVTTMAYDNTPGAGALYRTDSGGEVVQVLAELTIPNGPAFDADGATMYLSNSDAGSIDGYPVDAATGELGRPSTFARLEPGLTPDGLTVDAQQHLWVAVWDGSQVRRYRRDGRLDRTLMLPTSRPTSCCFGGRNMRRLFVTTARIGLDDGAAGAVYAFDTDVEGQPAAAFRADIA